MYCNCVILQIKEQGVPFLDLVNEEAFLGCAVVELVYKFNEKSTASVGNGEDRPLMCHSNFLGGSHIIPYIHLNRHHTLTPACPCACW